MKLSVFMLVLATFAGGADAAAPEWNEAERAWNESKDRPGYSEYSMEFSQYNNVNKFDEKNGCYRRPGGRVTMFLIITRRGDKEYAEVEGVLVDANTPKALCFRDTYLGLRTKIPPFVPLVLRLRMA